MQIGISTASFYPLYTERGLAKLASWGVPAAEVFINCAAELEEDYLKEQRRAADDAGMRILSVHPYTSGQEPLLFFSAYKRRLAEGMELYRRYCHAANLLGAEVVVFHGDRDGSALSEGERFHRMGELIRMGRGMGVDICQENVVRCVSRQPAFFVRLAEAVPEARFVYDIKQARMAGEDVYDFAETLGGRIAHLHLSDHDATRPCLPPGEGEMDYPRLFRILERSGFDGGGVVELYRDNFAGEDELRGAWAHLRSLA